jgi:GrpB-like predicted nucleotidyltransferase (UPF0157 family)
LAFAFELNMADFDYSVLIGGPEKREVRIDPYDPSWPHQYEEHSRTIRLALGQRLLAIHHIGSTSVPGLAAKPIIDILIIVADSSNENAYVPDLEAVGYVLRVREPELHEHRMLRTRSRSAHVHVYSWGAPEVERHLIFRDRLRKSSADRLLYEETKRRLAAQSWNDVNDYAEAKSSVVEAIIARAASATLR